MSFWVYILRCAGNSYYTGHTDNLDKRIVAHQTGEIEGYTSTRLPVTLVFADEFPTREEALDRERQIKGWSRKKKEAMMQGDWAEVSRLACSKHPSSFDKLRTNDLAERGEPSRTTGSGRTASKGRTQKVKNYE
ncbi:MAG: GIY-YIG nuclease family protein [Syntrophaceae bacterium]|nr:GIY-YIG nuclease family protein [Syntrophaceae bacterium]